MHYEGHLRKMKTKLVNPVDYQLPIDDTLLPLNDLIGQHITFKFDGVIHCIHCQQKIKRSFSQGYCYPCFKKLAACDLCIMSPEKCHYHLGTCREPDWADQFCMTTHIVYLANTTGIKVGITHFNQVPTRWMDQGAIQALPIFSVSTRQISGLLEHVFRARVKDKSNWRALLKGNPECVDLIAERDQLMKELKPDIDKLHSQFGFQGIQMLSETESVTIDYPVRRFPEKIVSFNFDKSPVAAGILQGIKGQYLLFDTGVLNIRKFTAYRVNVSIL